MVSPKINTPPITKTSSVTASFGDLSRLGYRQHSFSHTNPRTKTSPPVLVALRRPLSKGAKRRTAPKEAAVNRAVPPVSSCGERAARSARGIQPLAVRLENSIVNRGMQYAMQLCMPCSMGSSLSVRPYHRAATILRCKLDVVTSRVIQKVTVQSVKFSMGTYNDTQV